MKHIVDKENSKWEWSEEPFPAFRVELVFGRNKRDRAFFPVKDVFPIQFWVGNYDGKEYETRGDAIAAGNNYSILVSELPQGQFKVIKTKEKGTILVVPGEDTSNRALVFTGCTGGFRGFVEVDNRFTSAQIIKSCSAGNNCNSECQVIGILEPGQRITFHSTGRKWNKMVVVSFDGEKLHRTIYDTMEYLQCVEINCTTNIEAEMI